MLVSLMYKANKSARNLSDLIVGNYFEAHRDLVLITGGNGGLGRELVKLFYDRGAKVIILDVNEIDNLPENVVFYKCDVSNRQELWQTYEQIKQDHGIVTILINNAGITQGKKLLDLEYEEIEKVISINLLSSFYTIKTFLPDMLSIKRGYIITVGSVLGYMSPARLSAYGASKSGLIALHESLTYELGPPSFNISGVKTLLLCPGQLKTNMYRSVSTPSKLFAPELDPSYVSKKLIEAIELGRRGEIKLPFYGKFMPVFRAFPWPVVEFIRNISGIDQSMESFKNHAISLGNRTSSLLSLVPSSNLPESAATVVTTTTY